MSHSPPGPLRLGILVPSSNTVLEPTITTLLHTINTSNPSLTITPHFSRLRVTQISLSPSSTSQFTLESMLSAVSLVIDADVHAVAWCGTSAGWLGLDTDRRFCDAVTKRFGVPCTTATLAVLEYLGALAPRDRKVALLTPYVPDMNRAVIKNFAKEGVEVVEDRYLSIVENTSIAQVTTQTLEGMLDEVMSENPGVKVVTVFCTNVSAAGVAREWEDRYAGVGRELMVLDSVAMTLWGLLRKGGVNIGRLDGLEGLGRVFTT